MTTIKIDNMALGEYLVKFREDVRDSIFGTILRTKVLNEVMSKPEGKIIFEWPIEQYKSIIMNMVDILVTGNFDTQKKKEALVNMGMEAKVRLDFINRLASVLLEGQKHIENVKNIGR